MPILLHTKNYQLRQKPDSIYGTLASYVGAARRGAALLTSHWHLWLWKYFEMYTVMSARPTLTTFESNCRARICYYCFFFWCFDFYFWHFFVWVLLWALFGGTCIYSSSHQRRKIFTTLYVYMHACDVCMCKIIKLGEVKWQ